MGLWYYGLYMRSVCPSGLRSNDLTLNFDAIRHDNLKAALFVYGMATLEEKLVISKLVVKQISLQV